MRRLILSTGLSVGLLLSPVSGFAQSAHAPATETTAPAAKPPSDRALSLARRYFVAMHFEQTMLQVYENMDLMQMLAGGEDGDDGLDRKAMNEAAREAISALSPKMVEAMIPVVATHFTEAELEAMVTFYESDIGKSVIDKSATMNGPLLASIMDLMPDYMNDIIDRYCSKTNCSSGLKDKMRKNLS